MSGTDTAAFAVKEHATLPPSLFDDCWFLYTDAMARLAHLAIQRHLMTPAEFRAVCNDPRITKYTAVRDGAVVGMSVLTDDLTAVPLIEPRWFAHHFPDQYAARNIWYLGFACVTGGGAVAGHVFARLIERMATGARAARGMVFMDFCSANVARLIPGIRLAVKRLDPDHTFRVYDSQEFWGFDFREVQS
jgi:hypothetical protein